MRTENLRAKIAQPFLKGWYDHITTIDRNHQFRVLNYGFDDGMAIPLEPDDEINRYRLQLYHHVADAANLAEKDVLEVGSGRGGGASYVARHFNPKSVAGIDFSPKAVAFCKEYYAKVAGLSFSVGNAESLDSKEESFDAVLNIESSHSYPHFDRFLREVHRVLKPSGQFLFADFRRTHDISALQDRFASAGFGILSFEDITANVLSSLVKDNDQKKALLAPVVPKPLSGLFNAFAGMEGTYIYRKFQQGEFTYINIAATKV